MQRFVTSTEQTTHIVTFEYKLLKQCTIAVKHIQNNLQNTEKERERANFPRDISLTLKPMDDCDLCFSMPKLLYNILHETCATGSNRTKWSRVCFGETLTSSHLKLYSRSQDCSHLCRLGSHRSCPHRRPGKRRALRCSLHHC